MKTLTASYKNNNPKVTMTLSGNNPQATLNAPTTQGWKINYTGPSSGSLAYGQPPVIINGAGAYDIASVLNNIGPNQSISTFWVSDDGNQCVAGFGGATGNPAMTVTIDGMPGF